MNKVVLTKAQLKILADYIARRGFTDPVVVMEILDHFACKVEEKMAQYPSYSFEEAMYKAHEEFGVRGFQPIAAEFEKAIAKKYKMQMRDQLKKIFTSPLYIAIFLALAVVFYKGLYTTAPHPGTFVEGANDFVFWAGIVYFGVFLAVRWNVFRKPKSLVRGSLGAMSNYWYVPFAMNFIAPPKHLAGNSAIVYSVAFSIYMVFLIAREIAMFRIIRTAEKDIAEADNNYNAVLG